MSTTEQDLVFPLPLSADGTPDPLLLAAAREAPVLRVMGPGQCPAWLVAGEDAVREALSDTERFSSVPPGGLDDQRAYSIPLVGMDPPEHTRLRNLAMKAFTAGRIKAMAPTIRTVVDSLLDDLEAAGSPAELVSSVAYPLPLRVIFGMLGGIPDEIKVDIRRWTDVFTSLDSHSFEEINAAVDGYHACMRQLIAERRDALGDDLMSDLIRARDDDGTLGEDELIGTLGLLIVAGYETTAKIISRGVMALLAFGSWPRLVSGELQVKDVAEEILRHQSPNTAICRTAKVDTEFHGMPIKAGEAIYVSTHLANFDYTTHDDPEAFDPARTRGGHTTFGFGAHFCLGAALARTELTTVLMELSRRFPTLHMAVPLRELTWNSGSWLNAPNTLPVAW